MLTGFVLLRAKVADWRYQRASKPISLLSENKKSPAAMSVGDTNEITSEETDDQDIPPATEEIIEQLIQGLRDKVIAIRCDKRRR